jgi:hypothetical protein
MTIKFNEQDLSTENFVDVLNEIIQFAEQEANTNPTGADGAVNGSLRAVINSYNQRIISLSESD